MTSSRPPAQHSRLPVPPPDAQGDALWREYEAAAAAFRSAQAAYESALEEGDEDRAALFAPEVLATYEHALKLDEQLRRRIPVAAPTTGATRWTNASLLLALALLTAWCCCCGGCPAPWLLLP